MIEETLINRLLENLPKTFHQEIRDWADSQGPSPRADYWRLQAVESAVGEGSRFHFTLPIAERVRSTER